MCLANDPNIPIEINHTHQHLMITFKTKQNCLSSAVLNGGMKQIDRVLNLKVDANFSSSQSPQESLLEYCDAHQWSGETLGMMTAASMNSLGKSHKNYGKDFILALVTCGLSNLRRAGDTADDTHIIQARPSPGTINTIVCTSVVLNEAALAEALMIATEAKAAALQNNHLLSPKSNLIATGTGTDATAIISSSQGSEIKYCGKHVLFGELLAKSVLEATQQAIDYALSFQPDDA